MKRVSYKPLLDRFNIPRPTLIEWQKCPKGDEKNWRFKHIEYLREQIDAENETKEELRKKAILPNELFLICVYLFLSCIQNTPIKPVFKKQFKDFLLNPKKSIEHQHDFAKRIWKDDDNDRYRDYQKTMLLLDELTAFQYYFLIRASIGFNAKLFNNEHLKCSKGLDGKTWQELYTYDKEFSLKNIEEYFKRFGVLE